MTKAVAQAQHVLQPAATAGAAHMNGHVSSLACSHRRTAVHVPHADVPARNEKPASQASEKLVARVVSCAPVLTYGPTLAVPPGASVASVPPHSPSANV